MLQAPLRKVDFIGRYCSNEPTVPSSVMQNLLLANTIHDLRQTGQSSQAILRCKRMPADPSVPVGVLLLKPSSGYLPLETIAEILERLVTRHSYRVLSVMWWNGADIKASQLMSLHYPGFHRMAHGGSAALNATARVRLEQTYLPSADPNAFERAFGVPYDFSLIQAPYDLEDEGVSAERLNELWEMDQEKSPLKTVQRLDEDTMCLALQLPNDDRIPPGARSRTVILVNGFFAKLERDFERSGCVAILISKPPESSTSWDDLRTKFAGATNPAKAPANTVRGDAARGVLKAEKVSILANVIHLSANESEGRREVEDVWWHPRFTQAFE